MFTHKKTAQVAAFLASGLGSKSIKYMRLLKLMYLSDRESLARFAEPLSYDQMYSMDYGLVLSEVLNAVQSLRFNGDLRPWGSYFRARRNKTDYYVSLNRRVSRDELDFLSDSDIEILNAVLAKFGEMDEWALSQYMHDHCAEWKDPDGSRIPVDDRELLQILGLPEEEAEVTAKSLRSERQMGRIFSRR